MNHTCQQHNQRSTRHLRQVVTKQLRIEIVGTVEASQSFSVPSLDLHPVAAPSKASRARPVLRLKTTDKMGLVARTLLKVI